MSKFELNINNMGSIKYFPVYANDQVRIVYEACSCCYGGNNKKDLSYFDKKDFIKKRIKAGHTSILEHAYFAMCIINLNETNYSDFIKMSSSIRYLSVKTVFNEDNTFNILIGGSIRGYRYMIQNLEDYENKIYNTIIKALSEYSVDVFFEDLSLYSEFYNFNTIQCNPYNPIKDIKIQPPVELNNIEVLNYLTPSEMEVMCIELFKYCFLYKDILEIIPTTILFKNMSRTATHQLVRHRNGITQESQRYVDYSDANFKVPNPDYLKDKKNDTYKIKVFNNTYVTTLDELGKSLCGIYSQLQSQGLKKEDARAFLPNNVCCNKIYMTFTYRTLNDFLKLRTDRSAQCEIREYANDIQSLKLIPEEPKF